MPFDNSGPGTQQPPLLEAATRGDAAQRPQPIRYPENPRYRRIRTLSVLMDQSIVLPTGYRIGLDPLLGLLPGIGDAISALISCYLVYECARLGVKKRVLLRMLANIGLDTLVGSFPVLGDVFDAAWKSNMRNLRLVDQHYHPAMPERSANQIRAWVLGFGFLLMTIMGLISWVSAKLIMILGALFWQWLRSLG